MDLKDILFGAKADMETVSNRLTELLNLIDTVYLGLKSENAEKQSLDCIMCISYSVKGLLDFTNDALYKINGKEEGES